jgi:hypothetical protein
MIFVSYSHGDEAWRKRFEIMSKPLARAESMLFWSDRDIRAGEWEPQIERAMKGAIAAVLLVSDNFLASDYIIQKELPYLLRAHESRGLMIFWAYLDPCDIKRYPQIRRFQAMTEGSLKPMSKMTPWEWKQTMLRGCEMIDEFLKTLEQPRINPAVLGKTLPRVAYVPLLGRAARRRVEVLVYAGNKWWRQAPIMPGANSAKINLGDAATKKGTKFKTVAITTEQPLTAPTYSNLPDFRTKSHELTLIRG